MNTAGPDAWAHHVYGVGNALMDLEYAVDDGFLHDADLAKGHMTLVDEDRIGTLMASLAEHRPSRRAGGSAANTVFAVRGFGDRAIYSCRVADDDVGTLFLADMRLAGVDTVGEPARAGKSGRCLTLVTDDAERTMATFLGVSVGLSPTELDEAAVARAANVYLEGYLASSDSGCEAAVVARQVAEAADVSTCISLSDPSMVTGCRDGLLRMLGNGVHHVFCNEEEALLWAGTDRLDVALNELADIAPRVNVTLGARGSLAVAKGRRTLVEGYPSRAVDTTGAGDMYAGAVIHASVNGAGPADAARFGNFAASHLVSKHGARLDTVDDYTELKRRFRG